MRAVKQWLAVGFSLAAATAAAAHDAGVDHQEAPGWTVDPWIVAPLIVAAALFAVGWRRLHARSNRGSIRLAQRARLFGLGWSALFVALVSPLHQAGERSFAAKARAVHASWRRISAPVAATLLQATALWLWHAPALFDLALASDRWHAAQHLSFLVSALIFWTAMTSRRTALGVAALCLVATSIVSGALGALMAFATSPWYVGYARLGMAPFGLSPTEDQQLAGLLMWVPGGLVHAGAALLVMRRLLKPSYA